MVVKERNRSHPSLSPGQPTDPFEKGNNVDSAMCLLFPDIKNRISKVVVSKWILRHRVAIIRKEPKIMLYVYM